MSRAVEEWVGKTDDTQIPTRVRLRVFDRCSGKCQICLQKILLPEFDHIKALINGGENRESNIQAICSRCHVQKTNFDVAEKTEINKTRSKHLGIRHRKGRPMPGSKASGIRKRMSGSIEKW